jgi:hypothetical protein
MRFIYTIAVSILLLGSVGLCQYLMTRSINVSLAREVHQHDHPSLQVESASYTLRLTPAFDATRDPFALSTGPTSDAPRIVIRHGTNTLLASNRDVRRGVPLTLTNLAFTGNSVELHVEATPSAEEARRPVPLRVELFRDAATCADQTIWSHGDGHNLSATVQLSLQPRLDKLDRGLRREEDGHE